jgi:D-tyrosyl-tRNA(Tyr) deacylase
MKVLIQRVKSASVEVEGQVIGIIERGILVFLCAVKGDGDYDLDYLVKKVCQLRIFDDDDGKMNQSVLDIHGSALVVSQFTLAATTRKGNRPSFDNAETQGRAKELYGLFVQRLKDTGIPVQTGLFAAKMIVSLANDGPVTIWLDSKEQ